VYACAHEIPEVAAAYNKIHGEALNAGITEVAGLGCDGRRFAGCEVAFAGDATTGRWLVPSTQHVDPLPRSAFHHPSLRNVRVLLERIGTHELTEELALIFGAV
jgi:hypothetical protein